MTLVVASANVESAELHAKVIRCGCSEAQKIAPDWHGALGSVCPRPRCIEDRGRVAYWHRNPLKRAAWRVSRWLKGEFR